MLIVAIGRMIDGPNNRKVSENKTGVGYEILLDRIPPFIIHKKNNRKKRGASVSYYTKSVLEDAEGQLLFCV